MEDLTGKQLGPYQVLAPLGEGGMAAVYRAYQSNMEREVALKILPRHFADKPQFIKRFQQEARVVANLGHTHILPVHDFGEADGYTYLVMRLIDGGTLGDRLKTGEPLSLAEIHRIISQIGDALDYAHSQGVIHRDVKPNNILIDVHDNYLLTDFGIAKIVEGTADLTSTGGITGTPIYMSPEQILGETLDGRSDLYALGIMLYEMVTGRPPYLAETPSALFIKHIHDPLPLPSKLKPDIPTALENVILKSVAKERDNRYSSGQEMAQSLQTIIDDMTLPDTAQDEKTVNATQDEIEDEQTQADEKSSSDRTTTRPILLAGAGIVGIALICGLLILAGTAFVWREPLIALVSDPTATNMPPPTSSPSATVISTPTETPAPEPTPTEPLPTDTPTLTPTPLTAKSAGPPSWSASNPDFIEFFEDEAELRDDIWVIGEDGSWFGAADTGVYQLTNSDDPGAIKYMHVGIAERNMAEAAVSLDVKGAFTDDSTQFSRLGLLYRFDTETSYYYSFTLSREDEYVFAKRNKDGHENLVVGRSGLIRPDEFNTLGILSEGDTFELYINGLLVDTVQDDELTDGRTGIIAFSTGDYTFDNFTIYKE